MGRFLFLGNSHVAAYKLGHDTLAGTFPAECAFYAALGADLAFTEVGDGVIRPAAGGIVAPAQLRYFFPHLGQGGEDKYFREGVPLMDVGDQFEMTGGTREIALEGVDAIFYACGLSPYDFVRLDGQLQLHAKSGRTEMLDVMLGRDFILRPQIEAIRQAMPRIRHYFIGAPLPYVANLSVDRMGLQVVMENRRIVSAVIGETLFDDVFQPPAEVLQADLLSTRLEFFRGGQPAAQAYQNFEVTESDHLHVNRDYARIVLETFARSKAAAN